MNRCEVSPVRVPAGSLEATELLVGVGDSGIARWPDAAQHEHPVIEELEREAGIRRRCEPRVNPHVMFARAPDALGCQTWIVQRWLQLLLLDAGKRRRGGATRGG